MYHGKYAARKLRGASRMEFDSHWSRGTGEGLHSAVDYLTDLYSAEETVWLAAVDAWKTRKGPIIRAAELLVLLADCGYRRQGEPLNEADIDRALEVERQRRAQQCGRRGRHLTAYEVLAILRVMGWKKEGPCATA